jgi:hypothetical protein
MMDNVNDGIAAFLREYYASRQYTIWFAKIKYAAKRLDELKTEARRVDYILELYSAYLQLLEILLTNIRIATNKSEALATLFIGNKELRGFFSQAQHDPSFYRWFLTNIDFAIKEKDQINRYKDKFEEHEEVLHEVIKDYLADYEFLNAYKHGFRVRAALGPNREACLIYISRERDSKTKTLHNIIENEIHFKAARVYIKATFIAAMLDNLRLILGNTPGDSVNLVHYFFEDRTYWEGSFGTSRVKRVLFAIDST